MSSIAQPDGSFSINKGEIDKRSAAGDGGGPKVGGGSGCGGVKVVAWCWLGDGDEGGGGVTRLRGGSRRRGRRVAASDKGDRVDRVTRNIFGVGRKSPPEKFSGGGSEAAVVAGGGAGGGWWWPDIWRGREN
ncbi:hypothetical protein Tco_0453082 [Tanacetum coccineum]